MSDGLEECTNGEHNPNYYQILEKRVAAASDRLAPGVDVIRVLCVKYMYMSASREHANPLDYIGTTAKFVKIIEHKPDGKALGRYLIDLMQGKERLPGPRD